jgi:hypothetical protein
MIRTHSRSKVCSFEIQNLVSHTSTILPMEPLIVSTGAHQLIY